jgi:hypothetical protein
MNQKKITNLNVLRRIPLPIPGRFSMCIYPVNTPIPPTTSGFMIYTAIKIGPSWKLPKIRRDPMNIKKDTEFKL